MTAKINYIHISRLSPFSAVSTNWPSVDKKSVWFGHQKYCTSRTDKTTSVDLAMYFQEGILQKYEDDTH